MNTAYLGDALDHWKGDLLVRLEQRGLVRDLGVVGMFTGDWAASALATYTRLLHRPGPDALVLGARPFPGPDRARYWRDVLDAWPTGDLFLDPDTGLSERPSPAHVTVAEVRALTQGSDRLVVVYQHRWRTRAPEAAIREHAAARGGALAVWSGQAGLVFACEDRARIASLRAWLQELYEGTPGRVVALSG